MQRGSKRTLSSNREGKKERETESEPSKVMSLFQSLQSLLDQPGIPWKTIVLGFSIGQFAFETYLTYRQYKVLCEKKLPVALENEIDKETFEKSEEYSIAKAKFSVFSDVFGLIQQIAMIKYDLLPRLWHLGNKVALILPSRFRVVSTVAQSLWFLCVLSNLSTIVGLPLSYYQHFVLEEKFGFNKLTIKLWVIDMLKGTFLGAAIGGPVLYLFLKIFEKFQTNFIWYICLFLLVIQVLAITIIPVFIMPWFNTFTPVSYTHLDVYKRQLLSLVSFLLTVFGMNLASRDRRERNCHPHFHIHQYMLNLRRVASSLDRAFHPPLVYLMQLLT